MDIEKSERVNSLLDLYRELLTEKQKNVMDLYYSYDLSLAEIAEESDISRSAVYDLIKRTTSLLEDYETKLHLLSKREKVTKLIENLDEQLKNEILKNV